MTRQQMEVLAIAVTPAIAIIDKAGTSPATNGASWWDNGIGMAFDEGEVASQVPMSKRIAP